MEEIQASADIFVLDDFQRWLVDELWDVFEEFPAIALLGPRQCGKTTMARAIVDSLGGQAIYLDLELPSHRARLGDPELFFAANAERLIVLDEIHQAPEIFRVLRGVIDERRRQGRRNRQFLLLGSASLELLQQTSESLAGRIAFLELTPLLIHEVGWSAAEMLWVRGGFPNSFLARSEAASANWRRSFVKSYVERDIPMLAPRLPAATLHRLWQMLAHHHGQLLNAAQLAQSLGVSGQTIGRYLDTLVDLLLIRRLLPWAGNQGKRLVRSPKVYLRDSGVLHSLLGLRDMNELLGHPVAGASWEGMAVETILATMPHGTQAYFYRTSAGAEVDLVLQFTSGETWAFEMKLSLAPVASKGFHIACEDLGVKRQFLLYPGKEAYPYDRQTQVLPFAHLPSLFPKRTSRAASTRGQA
jgi:uncharacterized protein